MFKKVLSIALALLMLCSCIAVSSISTSALTMNELDCEKYDDNILFTGDEFIRNYSYGTYLTDNWPRQVSYNKDGWMRFQSQTAEEIAAGEAGTYDKQWSISFAPTPEYQLQFKNAIKYALEEGNAVSYQYFYTKSAQLKGGKDTQAGVDYTLTYTIGCDLSGDGVCDDYDIKIGTQKNFTVKHPMHEYQYQNMAFGLSELVEMVEMECDFELKSVVYQPRNYDSEGIGLLDLYISPWYVDTVPGTDVKATDSNAMSLLDIRNYINGSTFTSGKLDRDGDGDPLNDWQWKTWEQAPDDDHPPIYGSDEYGKKSDIVRDKATKCPIMANGTVYNPIPIVQLVKESDAVVNNLKASVSGSKATVTWTTTGSNASKYEITYKKDGKYAGKANVTVETYTLSNLAAGSYEVTVTPFNSEGTRGKGVKATFTISGSKPTTTKKPTTTACKHTKTKVVKKKSATYFAKGYSGDTVCAKCSKVIKKGKSVNKKVLKAPKVKLTAAKKSFKVKYTKLSGAAGFQVKYRVKGAKKWTIKNFDTKKTKTVTIKGLKKGKKYQVQVAAYAKSGKKKAVGKFTSTKTIKVK